MSISRRGFLAGSVAGAAVLATRIDPNRSAVAEFEVKG